MNRKKKKDPNPGTLKSSIPNQRSKNKKCENISPYFSVKNADSTQSSSVNKNESDVNSESNKLKDISWTELDDFKSPIIPKAIKQPKKIKPVVSKTKIKSKSDKKKQVSLEKLLQNNLSYGDVNPNHLQMAIALSKSTYEVENPEFKEENDDLTILSTQERREKIKTTLLEYGFKSNREKLPVDLKLQSKPPPKPKKSKYRFITPILNLRTAEQRENLIQTKVASILSSNQNPRVKKIVASVESANLNKMLATIESVFKLNYKSIENLNYDLFCVPFLEVEFSKTKCGNLLKDWHSIPCRDVTPERIIQKNNSQTDCDFIVISDSNSSDINLNDQPLKTDFQTNLNRSSSPDQPIKTDFLTNSNRLSPDQPLKTDFLTDLKLRLNRSSSPDLFETSFTIDNLNEPDQNINDSINVKTQNFSQIMEKTDTFNKIIDKSDKLLKNKSLELNEDNEESFFNTDDAICHFDVYSSSSESSVASLKDENIRNDNSTKLKHSFNIVDDAEIFDNGIESNLETEKIENLSHTLKKSLCSSTSESSMISFKAKNLGEISNKSDNSLNIVEDDPTILTDNRIEYNLETEKKQNLSHILEKSLCSSGSECSMVSFKDKNLSEKSNKSNNSLNANEDNNSILTGDKMKTKNLSNKSSDLILNKSVYSSSDTSINSFKSSHKSFNNEVNTIVIDDDEIELDNLTKISDERLNKTFNSSHSGSSIASFKDKNNSPKFQNSFKISEDEITILIDDEIETNLTFNEKFSKKSKNKTISNKLKDISSSFSSSEELENISFNNKCISYNKSNSFKFDSKNNTSLLNITEHINEILNSQDSDISNKKNISSELKQLINESMSEKTTLIKDYFENDLQSSEDNLKQSSSTELQSESDIICISDEEINYSSRKLIKNESFARAPSEEYYDNLFEYNADLEVDNYDIEKDFYNSTPVKNKTLFKSKSETYSAKKSPYCTSENKFVNVSNNFKDVQSCSFVKDKTVNRNYKSESEISTPKKIIINTDNVTPMLKYEEFTTPKLHEELDKFGLKPLKRKRGIEMLKYIYEATHPVVMLRDNERDYKKRKKDVIPSNSECVNRENSFKLNSKNLENDKIEIIGDKLLESEDLESLIFERRSTKKIYSCAVPLQIVWHNFVSSNPEILKKILTYEPLHIDYLHKTLKEMGFKFHVQDLISFLDKKCITIRVPQKKR